MPFIFPFPKMEPSKMDTESAILAAGLADCITDVSAQIVGLRDHVRYLTKRRESGKIFTSRDHSQLLDSQMALAELIEERAQLRTELRQARRAAFTA